MPFVIVKMGGDMGSLRRKFLGIQKLQLPYFRSQWGFRVDAVGSRLSGMGIFLPRVAHVVMARAGIWHPGSVFALQLLLLLLIHLPRAAPCSAKRHLQASPAMGLLQE